MQSRDFAYWLQGFFEISNADCLTGAQVEMVKRHLALVFAHEIDPTMGPKTHQDVLNAIHRPPPLSEIKMRC
jgi:hypothetical protein